MVIGSSFECLKRLWLIFGNVLKLYENQRDTAD